MKPHQLSSISVEGKAVAEGQPAPLRARGLEEPRRAHTSVRPEAAQTELWDTEGPSSPKQDL